MDRNLAALAIAPGLLILIYIYTKDRVEKEPVTLILKLVLFGAIACELAGYAEAAADYFLPQYAEGTLEYALINSFLLAGFWEEMLKFFALRLGSWKNKAFNYRFDGIVYGASAAIGFAVLENVMYVAAYGFQTAIVRAFTAVPLHSFCGVAMGIFYSFAKQNSILGRKGKAFTCKLLAFFVPMIIHGCYDTMAFLGSAEAQYALLIFVAIMYFIAVKVIKSFSRADYRCGFYPKAREINYTVEV